MNNLIFSSIGDNTEFYNNWISEDIIMNYDIILYYYGDNDYNYEKYKKISKFIIKKQGSKFQNFYHFFLNYNVIFNKYDKFFVLDDDILFENNVNDINKMFKYMDNYNLDICGPSFYKNSIIKHEITKNKIKCTLEYTNFVEVNTPLLNKKSIDKLFSNYSNELIGWGIDYLYCWLNLNKNNNNIAIIHDIRCINPDIYIKKIEKRELNKIKNFDKREEIWDIYKKNINFPETYNKKSFKIINYKCNNLIFTSAGDNTNFFNLWVNYKIMNYDIVIYYYGNNNSTYKKYKKISKLIIKRKGSKFQNFYHFYNNYLELINSYKYIFILDDDIIFENGVNDINKMFYYIDYYNLDICSPCFNLDSIISHEITLEKKNIKLEYTNFVEVCVPLFRISKLDKFMDKYDSKLIGWGIDYLYNDIIFDKKTKKNIAIIHEIKCINPTICSKKIYDREHIIVKDFENEEEIWGNYKINNNFEEFESESFDVLYKLNTSLKILYINLKDNKVRNDYMIDQFRKYNFENYKRIEGCNGFNVDDFNKYCYFKNISDVSSSDDYKIKYLSKGEMGCFTSHIFCIEYFLENIKDEYCIICEDDISFETLPLLDKNIDEYIFNSEIKNLEILNLCPIFNKNFIDENLRNNLKFFNYKQIFKKLEIWGTACYVISKSCAKYIQSIVKYNETQIDFCKINLAIDNFYNLKTNVINIPLFTTSLSKSIISNNSEHHTLNKNFILNLWDKNTINFTLSNNKINYINIEEYLSKYKNNNILFIPSKGSGENYINSFITIELFKKYNINFKLECFTKKFKNKIIFYGGGDNITTNKFNCQHFILNNINQNKIIILPNLISDCDDFLNKVNNNINITFLLSNQSSYNYVKKYYKIKENIILSNHITFQTNIKSFNFNEKYESVNCFNNSKTKDNILLSKIYSPKNLKIVKWDQIIFIYKKYLTFLNNYKKINTDIIEICILGLLLKKNITFYNHNNNINYEIYEESIKDQFNNITFIK